MLILQQKKVSPFPKSITPNPLFTGILKDLQGRGGFTSSKMLAYAVFFRSFLRRFTNMKKQNH
jgi:hypothetical protein